MAKDRDAVIAEVCTNGRNFWDAYDQGRLAYHSGTAVTSNPHGPLYPSYFHVNMADWTRGWEAEAALNRR